MPGSLVSIDSQREVTRVVVVEEGVAGRGVLLHVMVDPELLERGLQTSGGASEV